VSDEPIKIQSIWQRLTDWERSPLYCLVLHFRIYRLKRKLKDEDKYTRMDAAAALGEIGNISAVPGLIGSLEDEYWQARDHAVQALGMIAKRHPEYDWSQVVPALIELQGDKSLWVNLFAARALVNMGEEHALESITIAYIRGRIRYEQFDIFCKALNKKLSEGKFDKGTVAPPKKKPDDDLKRAIFRRPPIAGYKTQDMRSQTSKRCVARG